LTQDPKLVQVKVESGDHEKPDLSPSIWIGVRGLGQ
jgi:hypothetical protein